MKKSEEQFLTGSIQSIQALYYCKKPIQKKQMNNCGHLNGVDKYFFHMVPTKVGGLLSYYQKI